MGHLFLGSGSGSLGKQRNDIRTLEEYIRRILGLILRLILMHLRPYLETLNTANIQYIVSILAMLVQPYENIVQEIHQQIEKEQGYAKYSCICIQFRNI